MSTLRAAVAVGVFVILATGAGRAAHADPSRALATPIGAAEGVRYGADVSVAAIEDEDGSAWAAGAGARVGWAFSPVVAAYASGVALVGPYIRFGVAGFVELAPDPGFRAALGAGVFGTPKIQALCSDEPCGPNGFMCFEPCEHNDAALTAVLRLSPALSLPTVDAREPFSLVLEVAAEYEPKDGEIRFVQSMSFAFDEVVGTGD